jgi:probable rRNA maturation factor
MSLSLQIAAQVNSAPSIEQLQEWLDHTLQEVGADKAEIAVRIVRETESQALNREYRGMDKPTNVLAFPVGDIPGLPGAEESLLGDLVICGAVVEREAAEQNKPVQSHWAHMLIHGTLHLLGYDHLDDAQAQEMESIEQKVLSACGFADPYADRDE